MKKTCIFNKSTGQSSIDPGPDVSFVFNEEDSGYEYHQSGQMDQDDIYEQMDFYDRQFDLFDSPIYDLAEITPQINLQGLDGSIEQGEEQQIIVQSNGAGNEKTIRQGQPSVKSGPELQLDSKWIRVLQLLSRLYDKFKKNNNLPKFIGRFIMDYYPEFEGSIFANEPILFDWLKQKSQKDKNWMKQSKDNFFGLQRLQQYFIFDKNERRKSALIRLMMAKILQRRLRKEIIPNNQVKDKLEYLVTTKVYGLRCARASLARRLQMR